MALFVRAAGDHVAERVQAEPGSPEEARLDALVAAGTGWRRIEDPEPEGLEPSRPAQSANKDAWVTWAVSQGADREQAEGLTKAELVDLYGRPAEEE